MTIHVYNTMTRTKQPLSPRRAGKVDIYVCGVTPYAQTHIGHARPSVVWDVIRRYLRHRGYEVRLVQNFTDVEDKIIAAAAGRGMEALELAEEYSQQYLKDMDALGVQRADHYPRASAHMDDIIEMVQRLVDKGHAYAVDGDVYYEVSRFRGYGKLSGRTLEQLRAGARIEVDERKRDPADFALWKAAKPGEPSWSSPWGLGRPGWHIECSAMSLRLLGNGFEFHGGGTELIFPHHENEIAQSEAYTGEAPFCQCWVHHGMINLKEEKMSKSLGNIISIGELLERWPAEAFRVFLLTSHYRKPVEFSDQALDDAVRGQQRLQGALESLAEFVDRHQADDTGGDGDQGTAEEAGPADAAEEAARRLRGAADEARERFRAAMDDDFNTGRALAALFDLARKGNAFVAGAHEGPAAAAAAREAMDALDELGRGVLGVLRPTGAGNRDAAGRLVPHLVELLLEVRQQARAGRDFATADAIRDRLALLGVVVEDTPQGARWRLSSPAD